MPTKKYPISLNEEIQADLKELIDLLGIAHTYGDIPKAIKFSIKLALTTIKNPAKVYTGLNGPELDMYFSSIIKSEKQQRFRNQAEELIKKAEKV